VEDVRDNEQKSTQSDIDSHVIKEPDLDARMQDSEFDPEPTREIEPDLTQESEEGRDEL
jgi:hypothetical protein